MADARVVVRLPDGRFRVVVGTGRMGFSGDGGPAVDAELTRVTDLATRADGSLYIADGGRVRVVSPDGVIRTVAGDGEPGGTVADGTPTLSASLLAPLNSLSIALSPSGQLYVCTGNQLLRLNYGKLETIRAVVVPSGPVKGPLEAVGQVAIDVNGNIDVSGYNGWAIWQITPIGAATEAGPPEARRSGGDTSVLERAPDGSVYGEMGPKLVKIDAQKAGGHVQLRRLLLLTYFAFGADGTIYADEIPGVARHRGEPAARIRHQWARELALAGAQQEPGEHILLTAGTELRAAHGAHTRTGDTQGHRLRTAAHTRRLGAFRSWSRSPAGPRIADLSWRPYRAPRSSSGAPARP